MAGREVVGSSEAEPVASRDARRCAEAAMEVRVGVRAIGLRLGIGLGLGLGLGLSLRLRLSLGLTCAEAAMEATAPRAISASDSVRCATEAASASMLAACLG